MKDEKVDLPPEPGEVSDLSLGFYEDLGNPEPPTDEPDDEPTEINEDEEVEDDKA